MTGGVGGRHAYWEPILDQWRRDRIFVLLYLVFMTLHVCVCVFSVAAAGAHRHADVLHSVFPGGHLTALRGLREPTPHVRTAAQTSHDRTATSCLRPFRCHGNKCSSNRITTITKSCPRVCFHSSLSPPPRVLSHLPQLHVYSVFLVYSSAVTVALRKSRKQEETSVEDSSCKVLSMSHLALICLWIPPRPPPPPPPCSFRWVKDGEMFGSQREGSGTLRAEEDEPLDLYEGHYRCYASNNLGTAMTQSVQVIVEGESHTHTLLQNTLLSHDRGQLGPTVPLAHFLLPWQPFPSDRAWAGSGESVSHLVGAEDRCSSDCGRRTTAGSVTVHVL